MVEDVLTMPFSENILANESVQIYVHVFENQVNIAIILGTDDFFKFDDVWVA